MSIEAAVIGPGQGGQEISMGSRLAEESRSAWQVWEITNSVYRPALGYDLTDLVWGRKINGMVVSDEEAKAELRKTPVTQAVVFADSIARWIVGKEVGVIPDRYISAGFSLGQVNACVTAGAISVEDGIRLVKARGEAFNMVPGFLVALIDVEPEFTQTIMTVHKQQVGDSWIYLAMHNTPSQIVIGAKEDAREDTKTWLGAMKLVEKEDYVWPAVSGPFHTPDMEVSRAPFDHVLRNTKIEEPKGVLLGNGGKRLQNPDQIRKDLLDQTTAWQNFYGLSQKLYKEGVTTLIALSAKTTEINMLGQTAKSFLGQSFRMPVTHQFSSSDPVLIANQLKVVKVPASHS